MSTPPTRPVPDTPEAFVEQDQDGAWHWVDNQHTVPLWSRYTDEMAFFGYSPVSNTYYIQWVYMDDGDTHTETGLSERTVAAVRAQLAVDGWDTRVALAWLLGPVDAEETAAWLHLPPQPD